MYSERLLAQLAKSEVTITQEFRFVLSPLRLLAGCLGLAALSSSPYFLTSSAQAQTLPADLVTLEVLPGWRMSEQRHMAALRLTLAPGWKTYWRNPGVAGLPPVFDFSASIGITTAKPHWPVPDVFYFSGMRSIGYHDAVTIPLEISLNGSPARLAGEIEIGVCDEICVPVWLPFSIALPEVGRRDPAIVAALVDQPQSAGEAGADVVCVVAPGDDRLDLTLYAKLPPLGPEEVMVVESSDPSVWISEAASRREGDTLIAMAQVLARAGGFPALDRSRLRITVLGAGRAVEIQGCQAE